MNPSSNRQKNSEVSHATFLVKKTISESTQKSKALLVVLQNCIGVLKRLSPVSSVRLGHPFQGPNQNGGNPDVSGNRTMCCVGENTDTRLMSSLNFNHYATIKSMAEGLLDAALLMSNATQLFTVIEQGPRFNYYIALIVLISLSLTLQVVIFVLLIFIAKTNVNEVDNQKKLNLLNKIATLLVGAALLMNVFITALGAQKRNPAGITAPPSYKQN
ncbi:ninjurin-2-like isoform X2 [Heptranchias perlo]|uniref:ninjurin-2-like isoform X2 n=1 Tax=Heptranchias perlo TaxID=212740 RepID=UPI0035598DC4